MRYKSGKDARNPKSMSVTWRTNTAYLLNTDTPSKTIWPGIQEWVRAKHEQHWKGECDSAVIVTVRVLPKKTGKKGKK